jgi:DNA-binding transcriptional MerR regulator
MLRSYEQRGLLAPYRTEGGTRRYSGNDLDRIEEITTLLAAGLNLAGVEQVLRLRAETRQLQQEIDQLRNRPAARPDGQEVTRLKAENRALRGEVTRLQDVDPDTASERRPQPSAHPRPKSPKTP